MTTINLNIEENNNEKIVENWLNFNLSLVNLLGHLGLDYLKDIKDFIEIYINLPEHLKYAGIDILSKEIDSNCEFTSLVISFGSLEAKKNLWNKKGILEFDAYSYYKECNIQNFSV